MCSRASQNLGALGCEFNRRLSARTALLRVAWIANDANRLRRRGGYGGDLKEGSKRGDQSHRQKRLRSPGEGQSASHDHDRVSFGRVPKTQPTYTLGPQTRLPSFFDTRYSFSALVQFGAEAASAGMGGALLLYW